MALFAFDLLYLNGESLVRKTFRERRALLQQSFREINLSTRALLSQFQRLLARIDRSTAPHAGAWRGMKDQLNLSYRPGRRGRPLQAPPATEEPAAAAHAPAAAAAPVLPTVAGLAAEDDFDLNPFAHDLFTPYADAFFNFGTRACVFPSVRFARPPS